MGLGRRIVLDDEDICSGSAPTEPQLPSAREGLAPDLRNQWTFGTYPPPSVYPSSGSTGAGGSSGSGGGRRFEVAAPAFQAESSAAQIIMTPPAPVRALRAELDRLNRDLQNAPDELREIRAQQEQFFALARIGQKRNLECFHCNSRSGFTTDFNRQTVKCIDCGRIASFDSFISEHS